MRVRMFWSLAIAIQCLLWTGGITPAIARGGAGQVVGARVMGHGGVWGNPRLPYDGQLRYRMDYNKWQYGYYDNWPYRSYNQWQYGGAGGVWPSGPYTSADFPAIQDQTPVSPEVIILSNSPQVGFPPSPPPPAIPMDFGYVPGCRAIPNGYHCDPVRPVGQPE